MAETKIEWSEVVWNPVTGCSKVSPGCANCYAETISKRFSGVGSYPDFKPWTPENAEHNVILHPERLDQPLRWRKPRVVFVNSMSDLFHELVPDDFIDRVFQVMSAAERHTFQILTKRPERAKAWFAEMWHCSFDSFAPLPNVWLGVSIENARHTWRADVLREIPAAVRFLSCEPLLGSLYEPAAPKPLHVPHKWEPVLSNTASAVPNPSPAQHCTVCDAYSPSVTLASCPGPPGVDYSRRPLDLTGIDWVIVGGESGPRARPMHPDWARELRDACALDPAYESSPTSKPAFFFKQWGEWLPYEDDVVPFWVGQDGSCVDGHELPVGLADHELVDGWLWPDIEDVAIYRRVGKKRAGRELDGREWNEMPERQAVHA